MTPKTFDPVLHRYTCLICNEPKMDMGMWVMNKDSTHKIKVCRPCGKCMDPIYMSIEDVQKMSDERIRKEEKKA